MDVNAFGLLPSGSSAAQLCTHMQRQLSWLPPSRPVVVACSGGPDSVGLLQLVVTARPDLAVTVVYVDHGMQPATVAETTVAAHANRLNVAFRVCRVTVAADGGGWESAARDVRYQALTAVATAVGAAAVLVGHTADDQAETVWIRLLRGSGPDGLAAMQARDGLIARPLLQVRRETLHRFVTGHGLAVVSDVMNDDVAFQRVRVRRTLSPVLETLGDDPVASACRLAALAAADRQFFADVLEDAAFVVTCGAVARLLAVDVRAQLPVSLATRVVRQMLADLTVTTSRTPVVPSAVQVARVLSAATPSRFSVSAACEVMVDARWVTVARRDTFATGVLHEGPVYVPLFAASLGVDTAQVGFFPPAFGDPERFAVTLSVAGPLTVRGWLPGDTVTTRRRVIGVKSLFHAASLPVLLRRHWPVVCAGGKVVWVPGFAADDQALQAGLAGDGVSLSFTPT